MKKRGKPKAIVLPRFPSEKIPVPPGTKPPLKNEVGITKWLVGVNLINLKKKQRFCNYRCFNPLRVATIHRVRKNTDKDIKKQVENES